MAGPGRPPLLHSGLDRVGGQWVLWNVVASFCYCCRQLTSALPTDVAACLHSSAVPTYSLVYSRICVRSQSCLMSKSSAPAAPRSTLQYSHFSFFWRIVFQNFILEKKRENFVIVTDFSGFFVMQLVKLATSGSRHFLGRHLLQQFCKNILQPT